MIFLKARLRVWVYHGAGWLKDRLDLWATKLDTIRERAGSGLNAYASLPHARLATCQACPLYQANNRCADCGCYMPAKVQLLNAKCPKGKW